MLICPSKGVCCISSLSFRVGRTSRMIGLSPHGLLNKPQASNRFAQSDASLLLFP
jgi:hypothetical protein